MRVTSDELFTDLVDDIDGGEVLLVFMDLENGEDVQQDITQLLLAYPSVIVCNTLEIFISLIDEISQAGTLSLRPVIGTATFATKL